MKPYFVYFFSIAIHAHFILERDTQQEDFGKKYATINAHGHLY